jgi:Family of unknown function (DUF6516)
MQLKKSGIYQPDGRGGSKPLPYIDYRYHFQDAQNNLIFRYDSTPHFPELHSFPHHKHLPDQVIACKSHT